MSPEIAAALPGCVLACVLLLLLPLVPSTYLPARRVIMVAALAVAARYLFWRVTATLPSGGSPLEHILAGCFLVIELFTYGGTLVCFLTFMRHGDRSVEADRHAAELRRRDDLPAVDVFIPTYNEPWEVLERSVIGARGLDYPNKTVWVLDDTNRAWLRQRCAALGVRYIARPSREFAKAGNLNHGVRISAAETNAPIIMVLDADFIPRRDFLYRTVGFLAGKTALVQTPQFFFNPNSLQHNFNMAQHWVDEQRFFFDTLQAAKDGFDASFCCGTSFLVSRAALDEVGGFPTECITEDFLLSFKLMGRGYGLRYLNEELSRGLAPESIAEYIRQRTRWAIGNVEGLFLPAGPFGRNKLSFFQRVMFLDSTNYWLFIPLYWVFCLLVPILHMYFGVSVIQAEPAEYLNYFLPCYVCVMGTFVWCSGGRWMPVLSDLPEIVAAPEVTAAAWRALLVRGSKPFHVTAKGVLSDRIRVSWPAFLGAGLLLALTARGLIDAHLTPFGAGSQKLFMFWSGWNIILLTLVMLLSVERPRPRASERFATSEPVQLRIDDRVVETSLLDLSMGGARLRRPSALQGAAAHAPAELTIQGCGVIATTIVAADDTEMRLAFVPQGVPREALMLKLYAGDLRSTARRPQTGRAIRAVAHRFFYPIGPTSRLPNPPQPSIAE